jgi:hypothetical protein
VQQHAAVGLEIGPGFQGEDEVFMSQAHELGQVAILGDGGG